MSKDNQKVLDELMAKLTISKAQEDTNLATKNIAVYLNTALDDKETPAK